MSILRPLPPLRGRGLPVMIKEIRDRKHWKIRLGRWSLARWCFGAPCRYVPGKSHPIRLWWTR